MFYFEVFEVGGFDAHWRFLCKEEEDHLMMMMMMMMMMMIGVWFDQEFRSSISLLISLVISRASIDMDNPLTNRISIFENQDLHGFPHLSLSMGSDWKRASGFSIPQISSLLVIHPNVYW